MTRELETGLLRVNSGLEQRVGGIAIYGDGQDGNVTVSSNTTITSDMYYNNLTVNSGVILNTNGFRIFVKGTLTNNGFIGIGISNGSGGVTNPTSTTSPGTIAGSTTSSITYRLGGQGGGNTNPSVSVLPGYLYKSVDTMIGGVFTSGITGNTVAVSGGSRGTQGATGASTPALTNPDSWPNKAGKEGSTGSYGPNAHTVGASGGKGYPAPSGTATGATPGPGGPGGAGGAGGGVVAVIANTITGNGQFVSLGIDGSAGSAGSAGSGGAPGGANGAAAPNLTHTNPATSHPNPPTLNPSHHHHQTNHSDAHLHAVRQHVQEHVQQHVQEHVCCGKFGESHTTPHHHYTPHHHGTPHHHWTPHHHHGGHWHHPHNDGPHGGMHHYDGHHWHAYFQLSHHYHFGHWHSKPNGGPHGHSHGSPYGHHHSGVWHGNVGGHDGHTYKDISTHPAGHSPSRGGHSHHPNHGATYSHNHVAPTSHPNPDTVYPGGAGGVNDASHGRGAPAQTGQTGKRGGGGGGGAVIIVTREISPSITYNTNAGLLGAGADSFTASSGAAYVLIS